jgi:autotransporter-associated beta strand protein
LGSEALTLNDYDSTNTTTYDTNTTFSGVISGKGSFTLASGELTLTGVNTLTGSVVVSSDTLHLTGSGSVSQSSSVIVYGTLDLANANSAIIKSLSGSGSVVLGSNTLVLTSASGSFSGIISGTGGVTLQSGTQYLGGADTFTGGVSIASGATLEVASETVAYSSIVNNGTFEFYSSSAVALNSVITGSGAVTKYGTDVTTISLAQTYTGATTIYAGTIKLTGAGSIASSSGVEVDGVLDLTESKSAAITTLSGYGTVRLGDLSLAIINGSSDFSGTITGAGTLTLNGGSQSLSGASTYTGITTVNGGTLVLVAGASLKSAVTLATGTAISLSSSTTTTGSATIASLSGAGTVALGGNTLVLSSATGTFSGIISDSVTKSGSTVSAGGSLWISGGSETLSGANTYTGTTTVSAGTLTLTGSLATTSKLSISGTLDATGATGSTLTFVSLAGTGKVLLGSHALVLSTASATTVFSGVISGDSTLTVNGGGTETLSGANTYAGITTIGSGATLQIGNGSSSGSIASSAVVDNGTLKFYRMDSSTFSSVISGSGAVVQSGIGTTILTGANTYTGTTTISAGTLQIGDGVTTGSIASTSGIVDNGTLAFASPGAVDINTIISGSGNVSILSGIVTLRSANTYTGVTKIATGATLALTNTANINDSSSVAINGTLDLTGLTAGINLTSLAGSGIVDLGTQNLTLTSATTTFSGAISGTGGLILTSGSQVLSGTSTYSGATVLNGGSLSVTGSIASSAVTVNSGATLSGNGTIGALTVASGGTVKAGVSGAGTLSATGNVTLASGSIYAVDVTSAGVAKLATTGTANLTGSLSITSSDGTYDLGTKLTVVTASGGITYGSSFTTTSLFTGSNGAIFKTTLDKTSNVDALYLTINLSQLTPALVSTAAVNQKNVVGGVDAAIAAGTALPTAFEALGNYTSAALSGAADQLAGEVGADTPLVARSLFNPFLDALSVRTSMQRPLAKGAVEPAEVWVSAYTGTDIVTGDATGDGSHKFHAKVQGIVAGAQWSPYKNLLVGGAIAGGTSDFRIAGDLGKGTANSLQAGLYGQLQLSRHFYNSFEAGVALTSIKTSRVLTVSGTTTPDALNGKLTTYTFGGRYEAGVRMAWFTPYIGVQDQLSSLPAYTETAASGSANFALRYASRNVNAGRAEVGLRQQIDLDVTPRWILTPDFTLHFNNRVAYAYDLSDATRSDAAFASVPSSDFTVFGAKSGRQAALVTVGADVLFEGGVRLTTHLDSAFSQRSQSFSGFAGIGYTW